MRFITTKTNLKTVTVFRYESENDIFATIKKIYDTI